MPDITHSPLTAPLTIEELSLRESLEHEIRSGEAAFIRVGSALLQIRDGELYRDVSPTFEGYCQTTFGWSAGYGRRLIQAFSVAETVPIGTLTNEGQARELAKVEPSKRAEVLKKASESGKVTAKAIREAAEPKEVAPTAPLPDDDETLAYQHTIKMKSFTDAIFDWLASRRPTRRELIAAALHLKKAAADLERAAAQL